MAHPKDNEVYYEGTVVQLKDTHEFALIKQACFQYAGGGFMHYMAEIEGRNNTRGLWVLYHDEIELECYPMSNLPPT